MQSLVTLAHEISHGISNLDNNCKISNDNKIDSFAEIESELTEDKFLDYLKNNNLRIIEKKSGEAIRVLNDNDIDDIKYNKYKSAVFLSYRAIDELRFKNFMKVRGINNIDEALINELADSMGLNKEEVVSKIDKFINEYYPGDDLVHDYTGKPNYDLRNGKHLSNESRFIYAYCFVEKFNGMNLDYAQKCKFYNNYLENAKDMSFQNVLESFDVNLYDLNSFSNEFINRFNELSNQAQDVLGQAEQNHEEAQQQQSEVGQSHNTVNTFVETSSPQANQTQSLGNIGQNAIGGMENGIYNSAPFNSGPAISSGGRGR